MKYARIYSENNNSNLLIDACEIEALNSNDEQIIMKKLDEDKQEEKIVYGFYLSQDAKDIKSIEDDIRMQIQYALIYLNGLTCHQLFISEIEILKKTETTFNFIAKLHTPINFKIPASGLSAFLYYKDLGVRTSLVNRMGVFYIGEEEKRKSILFDWKEKFDFKRSLRISKKILCTCSHC